MLGTTSDLYSLDASSTHTSIVTTKNVSGIARCPLGIKISQVEFYCQRDLLSSNFFFSLKTFAWSNLTEDLPVYILEKFKRSLESKILWEDNAM